MSTTERVEFITSLCNAVRDEATGKVKDMPDDWDGHELRVYLADAFEDSASMSTLRREPRSRRARNYKNTITTTTL